MRVTSLFRYPIKGLSAEPLDRVRLVAGEHFPGDRRYAIENGPSGFDEANPEHQDKAKFLVLARQASLARLETRFDPATETLSIGEQGLEVARGRLDQPEGRAEIEAFFAMFLDGALKGPAKVRIAPQGFRFMDSRSGFVSLINLETIRAIEKEAGTRLDPIRFRANLYLDGAPAFAEFDWVGRTITAGGVVLRGLKRTERCSATTVNPANAARDVMVPAVLMRAFSHADCGIYCAVAQGGDLARGDRISVSNEMRTDLPF